MYYSIKADVLERLFFLRTALFCVFSVFLFLASFPLACHALSLCLPCPCSLPATCLHINRTIGQRWWVFLFCAPCLSFQGIIFFYSPACLVPAPCLPCACTLPALCLHPACLVPAPCLLCPCSLCALFLRMVGDGIARLVVNGRYRAMCCCEEGVG